MKNNAALALGLIRKGDSDLDDARRTQEDVHIVGIGLRRHERPEHNEAGDVASGNRHAVNTLQSLRHECPLECSLAEALQDVTQRRRVNSGWQITTRNERWQRWASLFGHTPFYNAGMPEPNHPRPQVPEQARPEDVSRGGG